MTVRTVSPLDADVERMPGAGGDVFTYTVAADETVLAGHYPGFPIFPGVCLLECVHQAVLSTAAGRGTAVRLRDVTTARFLAPVFPGDRVLVRLSVDATAGGWQCRASVERDGTAVATVRLDYAT